MPSLRNYHIMISHSWDYHNHYLTISGWLSSAPYFDWSDYSVPITRPLYVSGVNELKKKIWDRISVCSCVIVLSGMYVAYSDWIDYEIDTAKALGKPIIGVKPWGQERIPVKIQTTADVLVGWNSASVVDAVRKYAL